MQFRKGCRLWWLAIPVIALDRISKRIAQANLAPNGVKTAVSGVFSWAYTQNQGAAFSILRGRGLLLAALSLALLLALLAYLLHNPENPIGERIGIWLIIGGGMGNLYDRLIYGSVIDFIRLDFVRFAIFNVADIFVCVGAALVLISVLLAEGRKRSHG